MTSPPTLEIGSKATPIKLSLTEYEGKRSLDIRRYFRDKDSGQLLPTRKGIGLDWHSFREVHTFLLTNGCEIRDWLAEGECATLMEVFSAMDARNEAVEQEAKTPRAFDSTSSRWKAPNFYDVEVLGGLDRVVFNDKHPFLQMVANVSNQTDNAARVLKLLSLLLVAFHRAKLRFAGDIEMEGSKLFEMLEQEWGLILGNYCNTLNP
jgi:hypothetical protein